MDECDRALYRAIEDDSAAELDRLLAAGVRPVYHGDGWSPLHHAVDAESDFALQAGAESDLRLVGPLIGAGAEVNALWTRSDGRMVTHLDIALDYRNELVVGALRAAGGRRAVELSV